MYSKWRERLRHTLGLRLAMWYAVIFVASSLALTGLTYFLVEASLRQYDREIIGTALVQYAGAYEAAGVRALQDEIQRTQATAAPGPMLVRVVGARQAVTFLSRPDEWRDFDLSRLRVPSPEGEQTWSTLDTGRDGQVLEVASVRLRDGALFQVGMSSERRRQLLQRFRRVLIFNVFSLIFIGLAGGAVLTSSALQPVRRLADTVRGIMRTGRTEARVPAQNTGDALDELSALVNAMLDRIDAVLAGMRGALTDLNVLIAQTVEMYEDVAEERGVRVETRTAPELVANVDRNRLRQVLANLLDNAVKYTSPGGRVEIRAGREDQAAVVEVTDTGAGIPPD